MFAARTVAGLAAHCENAAASAARSTETPACCVSSASCAHTHTHSHRLASAPCSRKKPQEGPKEPERTSSRLIALESDAALNAARARRAGMVSDSPRSARAGIGTAEREAPELTTNPRRLGPSCRLIVHVCCILRAGWAGHAHLHRLLGPHARRLRAVRAGAGGREAAIDEIRFGNLHPCGEVAEAQELVAVDRRRALVALWRRAAVEVDCGARGCEAGAASCATAV